MKTGIIIQARATSSRLPEKIFKKLPLGGEVSVLGHVITRSKKANENVIVATSLNPQDDKTELEARLYGADVYRGSLDDVLARYIGAAEKFKLDNIIRITSDCPCVEPALIQKLTETLINGGYDYVSNIQERTFPHGLDTEILTFDALMKAHKTETRPEIREHVTYHIRLSDNFKKFSYIMPCGKNYSQIRVTIDTINDYYALCALFSLMQKNFSLDDIINTYQKFPWISELNNSIYQKEPFTNETQELEEAIKLLKLHNMERAVKMLVDTIK